MDDFYNKHFIRLDGDNITHGFSDAFEQPVDGDICLTEQGGYQFRLTPDGEENPPLRDEYGIPLYCYVKGNIIAKTPEELETERPEQPPTPPDTQAFVRGLMEGLGYE